MMTLIRVVLFVSTIIYLEGKFISNKKQKKNKSKRNLLSKTKPQRQVSLQRTAFWLPGRQQALFKYFPVVPGT